jgi:predicted Ser/Thr protein kinase
MDIENFCKTIAFKHLDNLTEKDKKLVADIVETIYDNRYKEVKDKKLLELLYAYFFKEKMTVDKKWVIKNMLGKPGKEGVAYIVYDINNPSIELVMKQFKKNKSFVKVRDEVKYQLIASSKGISPLIYEYGRNPVPYIIMEKMNNGTIMDVIGRQRGILTNDQQNQLIDVLSILDQIKINHNDPNLLNLMFNDDKLYIIDFGMAKFLKDKEDNVNLDRIGSYLSQIAGGLASYVKNDSVLLKYVKDKKQLDRILYYINKNRAKNL